MQIDWGSAVVAGLVATAVMTALMYMGKAMGMRMDMPRMLGLMFTGPDNTGAVFALGLVVHFMMGVQFAIIYAALFGQLGITASWLWGAVFGAVHGVITGMAFEMMRAMHPRMGDGQVLASPGPFGVNYRSVIPVGVMMLHIIFGAVVGWLYAPLGARNRSLGWAHALRTWSRSGGMAPSYLPTSRATSSGRRGVSDDPVVRSRLTGTSRSSGEE